MHVKYNTTQLSVEKLLATAHSGAHIPERGELLATTHSGNT